MRRPGDDLADGFELDAVIARVRRRRERRRCRCGQDVSVRCARCARLDELADAVAAALCEAQEMGALSSALCESLLRELDELRGVS